MLKDSGLNEMDSGNLSGGGIGFETLSKTQL